MKQKIIVVLNLMEQKEIENNTQNRKNYEDKITGTKESIEKRQNKVYLLSLQGYSNNQIANSLGVSLSTIEKDLHYMKYYCLKWTKDLIDTGQEKSLLDVCNQIDLVQAELWNMYRKEDNVNAKKRILDSIVSNSIKKENRFESVWTPLRIDEKRIEKLREEMGLENQVE